MRVTVTGASGRLGRVVVDTLRARAHTVNGVDTRPAAVGSAAHMVADLRDMGQAVAALVGSDAVIHLAAIPVPGGHPPEVVYSTNMLSTFHVFEAAAALGIRRVIYASSVSALGFPWQHRWSEPHYLPIDEAHPLLPQDCYGLSKGQGEDVAAAYARRGAGSAVSLRFSTILSDDSYGPLIRSSIANPGGHAHLLWSYVDQRDAALACALAVEAKTEGHQPLFITADDTTSPLPTDELLDSYFPAVPRLTGERSGRWSLLNISRAAEEIGYRPHHRWEQVVPRLLTDG
jgi:UDP-glucose 4-epimerase